MSIHPQVIEKEGKKEFVVLPYEEFLAIKESLEDFEDLKDLRKAKAESAGESTVKLADVRNDLLEN
jgi:PHD/YefM family antitoxin component YafN of YafNO toxin-antitoxin module